MFDFVWHLRGSIRLDGVAPNAIALDRVEQLLRRQRKSISERGSDFLVFDDPLWRDWYGPNWLAMVIYDRGWFWIEQDLHGRKLRYELRSLHGMVFCLCAASIAFFFGLAGTGSPEGLSSPLGRSPSWRFNAGFGSNVSTCEGAPFMNKKITRLAFAA